MNVRRPFAALATVLVVGAPLATPAAAAMSRSACAGKGVCCATPAQTAPGQVKKGDRPVSTECPPPTVPEVPLNVLLPASAAVVAGVVVVGSRRRRRVEQP